MAMHRTGTRQEWRAARVELLQAEKEHTRRGDDLARRRADVLEAERNLANDAREHDLLLWVLEQHRDRPGELRGSCGARVSSIHDDATLEPAAVEVRDEARKRAEQRRLARAGRAEEEHDLARLDREGHVPKGGSRARIREGHVLGAR